MDDKAIKNLKGKIHISYFNIGFMVFIYLSNLNIDMGILKAILITQYSMHVAVYKIYSYIEGALIIGCILISILIGPKINFLFMLSSVFGILLIYYLILEKSKYMWIKIVSVILIIPMVISINNYMDKDELIKNRGLRNSVRDRLEYKFKTKETNRANLNKIDYLYISDNDQVYKLDGIEHLSNIQEMHLDLDNIKSLEPLSKLQKLRKLELDHGRLSYVVHIKGLSTIEELTCYYVKINDFFRKDTFTNLKKLEIQGGKLKDLSFCKNLKSLQELQIKYGEIGTLDGIEEMKNLKKIKLYKSRIKDDSLLKNRKDVEIINLD